MPRLVVVTGGPGSGKSTLVGQLSALGHATQPEAGRAIIQDQVAISGRALPWADPELFAELMLAWDLRSYRAAAGRDTVFDRGIVDTVGYLRMLGRPVPPHLRNAALTFRYHRRVFAAPPWPEIYEHDAERRQSLGEAERTYEAVVAAYAEHGYEAVTLPRAPVAELTAFLIEAAGLAPVR
ncbi:AAA family ATPase [Nonomuraea aridisoli]|uniref:ATPase n=1 Tax=Nonomuraea aridisoli TaxID=2070368 RepID=A0A2W2EXU1_9ACTN|nr:AAA family ATPase [Nonomuraea aridisoli]PZG14237.1 ATPase [Nonomuraea aridisoli]